FSPSDTFVSHLVSIAIEGVAHADTFEVLQHPDLDRELAQAILDYLQQLSPRDSLGSMIQGQERIFLINFVLHFSGHGPGEADPPRGDDEDLIDLGVLARGSIDWNVPLRQLNDWCDRVAQACALPDRASQHAALMTLQQETEVLGEDTVGKTFGAFFSPQARSQLAAD